MVGPKQHERPRALFRASRSIRRQAGAILLCAFGGAACTRRDPSDPEDQAKLVVRDGQGFYVEMPESFELQEVGQEQKIDLYRIRGKTKETLLTIYAGESPAARAPKGAEYFVRMREENRLKCTFWDKKASAECFVSRPGEGPILHGFYEGLSPMKRGVAEYMLGSLRVVAAKAVAAESDSTSPPDTPGKPPN